MNKLNSPPSSSSGMFPFASHETYGYSLAYCATLLAEVGALAEKYGHRLTAHPGQYTQLGSPREAVVRSSIRDLEYHCEMLDLMGVGPDGVIVIHGGGVYGDKEATLARIKETIRVALPKNVRDRLVLENDEVRRFSFAVPPFLTIVHCIVVLYCCRSSPDMQRIGSSAGV